MVKIIFNVYFEKISHKPLHPQELTSPIYVINFNNLIKTEIALFVKTEKAFLPIVKTERINLSDFCNFFLFYYFYLKKSQQKDRLQMKT